MLRSDAIRILSEASASITATYAALQVAEEVHDASLTGNPATDPIITFEFMRTKRRAKYAIAMAMARKEDVYKHFPDMKPPARKEFNSRSTPESAARKKQRHEQNLASRREADRQRTDNAKSGNRKSIASKKGS